MCNRIVAMFLLLNLFFGCDKSPVKPEPTADSLEKILTKYQAEYKLPSLVGGVIENDQTQIYACGVRKNSTTNSIKENDQYYIGSNTKAMTATMIATLVEENLLSWDSNILAIFPELNGTIPTDYGQVTLTQLLNHHGGIKPFEEIEALYSVPPFSGSIKEQRYEFTKWVLNQSDKATIGSFHYSNAGYVIAAVMAEKVTNQSWEALMTNRLLNPLGIEYYFDWPAENGRDKPWGHTLENGTYFPFNPDSSLQFPVIFNPAGNISMNMQDYLKFIKLHLDGLNGNTTFLDKNTFEIMHASIDNSSMGWAEGVNPDTGIPLAFHEGSDGTFDVFVIIKPTLNKGAAVFTNCASEKTSEAIILACIEIIENVD